MAESIKNCGVPCRGPLGGRCFRVDFLDNAVERAGDNLKEDVNLGVVIHLEKGVAGKCFKAGALLKRLSEIEELRNNP